MKATWLPRCGVSLGVLVLAASAAAQEAEPSPGTTATPSASASSLPFYLEDRGTGVSLSQFGTYIRRGELIVYPFYEYYHDNDLEYAPVELGAQGITDYRGRYRANEGLLFLAYGISENFALELEAAVISASFEKSPTDPSALPARIEESGLGDVEGQLRWRWKKETEGRPELFSYFEAVVPHSQEKVLIGTPGWELKLGAGATRGFRWGTLSARLSVVYEEVSDSHYDIGEFALEYLKRVSPTWRFYVGFEGTPDEMSLITEVQWHLSRNVFFKLNNGLGLTSRATDWAPEVGILFTLPTR